VAPAACRDLAGIGCRTGGGCHRGRTACTGRRDRARQAAPRAGTMGPGQRSRSTTRTAGADQAQSHRVAATFPAARGREAPVREEPSQAMPFLEEPVRAMPFLEEPVRAMPFLEEPVRAMPFLEEPVRVASVPALVVREVALRGPVRGDRARAPRTRVHRHTAGPARPGSPDLRYQAGQAGLRRCASTRRPGPASKRRTDVTGPARRRSRRVR
jgi:hypothetical protein